MNSEVVYDFICHYNKYEECYENYRQIKLSILFLFFVLLVGIPLLLTAFTAYGPVFRIIWISGCFISAYPIAKIVNQTLDWLFNRLQYRVFKKAEIYIRLNTPFKKGVEQTLSIGSSDYKEEMIKKLSFY